MEHVLSTHFDRIEKALGTLVDSIAAYNPSPQAAIDLVAADDELSHGLDQLSRHQANHARILALRAQVEALEEQKKASVAALATLRHELHATPATSFPADTRPVRFDELLQYAKNISQYTVPPTYRERAPEAASDKDKDDAASSGAPTNAVNTPTHAPAQPDPDAPKDGDNAENKPAQVTAEEEEWLEKLQRSQIAWYPWPSDEKINTGNLYQLMYWQARGEDVDKFNVKAHQDARRKGLAGVEAPADPEPVAEPVQAQAQAQAPRPARPAQPQATFDMFDDLDD